MEPAPRAAPAPGPRGRRGLVVAIALNVVLLLVASALALYAFMLNVDLGDLKRRVSREIELRQQAERYLSETRDQLTTSLRANEQLKAQLAYRERDFQQAAALKPSLPVVVNFRSSLLGKGLVAVIENQSDRYLTVVLSVRNPTLSVSRRYKLDLDPREKADFGHMEGWQFVSGDEFSLFNDEFAPLRLSVP